MILILSDSDEPTTDLIINWLAFYKKRFVRVSNMNTLTFEKVYTTNNSLEIVFSFCDINGNIIKVDTNDVTSYWYRRSSFSTGFTKNIPTISTLENVFIDIINNEKAQLLTYLNLVLKRKRHINSYLDNHISKLNVLNLAMETGINIPNTIITKDFTELSDFYYSNNQSIITKAIGDITFPYDTSLATFTYLVDLDTIPETFNLSLFQANIVKICDLRIFYFDNKFYSSAILSQKDDTTKIDFRHYNDKKPNRVVPFNLPIDQENRLRTLFEKLGYNCGSVDMVYGIDGKYYFLEINPIGQFEQVTLPCNYYLDKKIAEFL